MAAAYDGLPDDVKDRIGGMFAVHDFALSYGLAMSAEELAKAARNFRPLVTRSCGPTPRQVGRSST